jgi:hypothetical protein
VQSENAAARSFVIDANKNVFQNANGPRVQCGARIVDKSAQIISGAPQRGLIDCAAKRQK